MQSGAGVDVVAAERELVANRVRVGDVVFSGNVFDRTLNAEAEALVAVVDAGRLVGDDVPLAVMETLRPPVRVVYIQSGSPADSIPRICCCSAAHAGL